MRYNKIGDSDTYISEIGYGTIPILKGPIEILPTYYSLSNKSAITLLRKAFNFGINFFDTARAPEYGDAEKKLGMAFHNCRQDVVFASKAKAFTKTSMRNAIEQSLQNLRTDYIDIYLIHQLKTDQLHIALDEDKGALAALIEAKEAGLIKMIGVGTHYAEVAAAAERIAIVSVIEIPCNILEVGIYNTAKEVAQDLPKKVIFHKVLAGGALIHHFSINSLIKFALDKFPLSVLIGIGTMLELEELVSSYGVERDDSKSNYEAVGAALLCDRCQKCSCEYDLRISHLLRYRAYALLGFKLWALDRWSKSWPNIGNCDNCGKGCRATCPKGLNIPKLLSEANDYFKKLCRSKKE